MRPPGAIFAIAARAQGARLSLLSGFPHECAEVIFGAWQILESRTTDQKNY